MWQKTVAIFFVLCSYALSQHPAACSVQAGNAGGSACLIANSEEHDISILLGCHHVVEGVPRYGIISGYFPEAEVTQRFRLIAMNSQLDISLAVGKYNPKLVAAKIASEVPKPGDVAISDGFPAGASPRAGRDGMFKQLIGNVAKVRNDGIFNCTFAPDSGQSGSPVFNDAFEIIGSCNGYYGQRLVRDQPDKHFGFWLAMDESCPAMRWVVRAWEERVTRLERGKEIHHVARRLFPIFKCQL